MKTKKEQFKITWLGDLSESEQEDAVKALESLIAEEIALAMADIVEPPKSKPDTITVKALRKRGTDKWYAMVLIDEHELYDYAEITNPIESALTFDEANNYPPDAELVTLECRIKTIDHEN